MELLGYVLVLVTSLKVLERLLLKVLEQIQPEPLLQTVTVVSEETFQSVPAGQRRHL